MDIDSPARLRKPRRSATAAIAQSPTAQNAVSAIGGGVTATGFAANDDLQAIVGILLTALPIVVRLIARMLNRGTAAP